MMALTQDLLLFLCILSSARALYKQWIPDTNFENATNWDKGAVPCGSDQVVFPAQNKVAVYVGATHTLSGMILPMDGEFILASRAGFSVRNGPDPACGAGVTTQFKDQNSLKWFDPALWNAAASADDLHKGSYLFFVHEESVPCRQDDVMFRDASSFRVDISANGNSVPVKSVSVLGQTFSNDFDFSQYVASSLGKLQFHGSSVLRVEGSACNDPTGCLCGNSANHDKICVNVECPQPDCKKPLRPAGHCCEVCGAIVTIQFSASFNLQSYRQHLQDRFLSLPKYKSLQAALSKVSKTHRLLGVLAYETTHEIQMAVLDQNAGPGSEALAEGLAREVVKDASAHGSELGIDSAEFEASSGAGSSDTSSALAGNVAGGVLGTLVVLTFIVLMVVLFRKGKLSVPHLHFLRRWRKDGEIGEVSGPIDHGFDNPMFEKNTLPDVPGLYGEESLNTITLTQSGVHFINPVYDETDFTA
ncbi:protein amnionless [Brachyhypopomus gauderio]|uniref:protein amnionless n=1 Tax=Brachyhypopomus gauderio TaxID=698409 RepID=UPI004043834F